MPVRDHNLRIEFIPAQPYDALKAQYNSCYHTDMEPQHIRIHPSESNSKDSSYSDSVTQSKEYYDGVETWLNRGARAFMKRPPWGEVVLSGACLDEVRELGNLAQVDRQRLERAVNNSTYLPGLVEKIDRCIKQHRESPSTVDAIAAAAASGGGDGGKDGAESESESKPPAPIFCRINECSMKQSSEYTPRPVTSGTSILTSLLTDRRAISWLATPKYAITSTTLYLSDFDTSFACTNEYRVFVWEGRVTGVSQYRWFITEHTEYHTEESAKAVCEDIVRFMEGKEGLLVALAEHRRKEHLARDPSVPLPAEAETMREMTLVADVVHTEGRVYLVEINLFGGETGCGSSLFHWKRDEYVLYSDGKDIVGRFFARSNDFEPDVLIA